MKILLLTQWFNPEPMFKGLAFAEGLKKKGHDVEVLTGFPNYPGGKVYNGYRIKPWQSENMNGVRINRVALYPSHDSSGLRRILNYLSFSITSLLFGPWLVQKPDVVYVYNLITLAPIACLMRWLYGCKIVYDVQDLWPESVASSGMLKGSFFLRLLNRWAFWSYNTADRIVVLSPGFKQNLQDRGIPSDKIDVIYNWCPEGDIQASDAGRDIAIKLGIDGTFNVVFAGTMGVMQGLDTVIDAASICAERLKNIRFVFIGDGIEKKRLTQRCADLRLKNVIFVPRQPMREMGKYYAIADALLVHLKRQDIFRITIPSKTQAYLAAGRPIVMAVEGDAADLVREADAGLCCPPEDPFAMADCIEKISVMAKEERERIGQNGKDFYEKRLSFEKGLEGFETVFNSLDIENIEKDRKQLFKNVFDYCLTIPAVLLLSPFLGMLFIIVRYNIGAPVLFKQIRPGLHGIPFTLYKFRTMTDERDAEGNLLPDAQRLTGFGRFLRSTSLDELPELINVLKGEMSLVGPRPLLMEYLPLYSKEQARRHEVRPGITGWAQVNGRNALSWEKKFKLDVWYVENHSLWLDLKIIFQTIWKVLRRDGISAGGEATMPRFTGSSVENQ